MAGATMAGHLLECGAQVTGGYFADPGYKDVPDLDDVGFPIAEIAADGSCIVTKAANTGGLVDARTVKEQLLYELHDPAMYLTPDVVADISDAEVTEVGTIVCACPACAATRARRRSSRTCSSTAAGSARARSPMPAPAPRRARGWRWTSCANASAAICTALRSDRRRERAGRRHRPPARCDAGGRHRRAPARGREARRLLAIDRLLREVTALWTGGPAGGGGVRIAKRQRLSQHSCLVPRERVPARLSFV